jgi:hypothetical protein
VDKTINIKTVRIDGSTQSRVEINNEIVTEYADAIKAGAEFPAVVVFNDGVDNWMADGFHRFHAHGQAGKASILADVRTGTARDAVLFSFGANGTHGLNRTNADKRKAVTSMLSDSEWAKWSDNAIAKACQVTHPFVGSVRKSLVTVSSEKPVERTFTTKHGTTATMQTTNIGKVAVPVKAPHDGAPEQASTSNTEVENLSWRESATEETYSPDEEDSVAILSEENDRLNDRLAAMAMDATEEERAAAHNTLTELRAENKTLRAMNKQLTISRDGFQNQVAEMQKQINLQRREIDKLRGTRTA